MVLLVFVDYTKDGKITYVNGYVMETDAAPRKMMKARSKNGPKGDVVLVEADGEFRYAVKSFDESAHEFVYTDVETGRVLKRLSIINHAHAPKGPRGTNSQRTHPRPLSSGEFEIRPQ